MNFEEYLSKKQLPAAFVDLDAFDHNAKSIISPLEGTGLTLRIASKSVRCVELLKRVLNSSPLYQGLMCYSAQEILMLAKNSFDNFLLAYPTLQSSDIQALAETLQMNKEVYVVVDNIQHLKAFDNSAFTNNPKFHYLVDVDLSLRLFGVVIGVRRSPLNSVSDVVNFCCQARDLFPHLNFGGFMAYEAQVAGLPDSNPFKGLLNPILKLVRKISVKKIINKRKNLRIAIEEAGFQIKVFNGGGTGSLSFNLAEKEVLTELTAGSGLYCPHLFDYYSNFKLQPAAYFALPTVRKPEEGWLTCLGGGYIASGEPGWDRVPRPMNAEEKLSPTEACGEVQTPVKTKKKLGEAILFRHAKAGELMERFNEVQLVQKSKITNSVKTYRGEGWSFL